MGRTQGLLQVLLWTCGGFRDVPVFPPLILGRLLQVPEEDVAAALVSHLWDILSTHTILRQAVRDAVCSLQGHSLEVETEVQREVGVGGSQMRVGRGVDGRSHLGGIILVNLEAHG